MNINELIHEMTLEEKCTLLTGGGALKTAAIERLNIPKLEMSDGPHGVRRLLKHPIPEYVQECNIDGGDVCFPTASAMGSTWNKELVYETGQAIARDCIEEGIEMLLAPGVNMKRTPFCGRNFEYFSEDPLLSGELGAAFIQGVQSKGVGTSLKHFAANNQEIWRSSISVEADERTLREYYLKPFEIAVKKGKPVSVMCAYNKLGGIWCSENKWLLQDVLRKEWGYDGLIVSDWHAVHNPSKALAAGMDLQMPRNLEIIGQLRQGLEQELITEEDINRACSSILGLIARLKEQKKPKEAYHRGKQHEAAYHCAAEAITLLKNHESILPIQMEQYKGIAVYGEFAKTPVIMGGGSSKVTVEEESIDRPLDYMIEYTANRTNLVFEPIYGATIDGVRRVQRIQELAQTTDLAIVFAANEPGLETEGADRNRLTFSDYINDTMEEICSYYENVIIVMQSGSCIIPAKWAERAKGILQMWYSGEAGGRAIADILFGTINPSGKLSETFISKVREGLDYPGNGRFIRYNEGSFHGYRYYDCHPEEVWYPFGHGLSYTNYDYSDLSITPETSANEKQEVIVSFRLKNIGRMRGKEIVQLYVGQEEPVIMRPDKELKAFDKIELEPGEEKLVVFPLDAEAFSYYNPYLKAWHVESGYYTIKIGASSQDIRLTGEYKLTWDRDYTVILKNKALIL
ncbi:beta-glucosidase [Anaerotaenia torta]|uniref:beta-glucosidase n=1 Tax=Anaerotaenia torta TaxID=433293 RepID=UPI003D1C908A